MTLERDIEILRSVPFFEGIAAEPMKLLAFSAEPRDLADKVRLFEQGDEADGGHVLIDGRIDLVDESASPPVVKERLGPGALLGELALIVETTRPMTAVSVGRSRVLTIRRSLFRRMLGEYPEVVARLHERISERMTRLEPELTRIAETLTAIDEPDERS